MAFIKIIVCLILITTLCKSNAFSDEYLQLSSGIHHQDCVHSYDQDFEIIDGFVIFSDGKVIEDTPCPHAPYVHDDTTATTTTATNLRSYGIHYYSGWVSYAWTLTNDPISNFESTWNVPPKPPSTNLLTTTFLFNGLEDKFPGSNFIMQPVLQYGFSGCGGGLHWIFGSFYVSGSGRAYCGKMYRVHEGDELKGEMNLLDDGRWSIVSTVLNKSKHQVSTYVADINNVDIYFATCTLEIIRAYSCGAYPGNTQTTFSNNLLKVVTKNGKRGELNPKWERTVKYHECEQDVTCDTVSETTGLNDIVIHYNPHHSNSNDIAVSM